MLFVNANIGFSENLFLVNYVDAHVKSTTTPKSLRDTSGRHPHILLRMADFVGLQDKINSLRSTVFAKYHDLVQLYYDLDPGSHFVSRDYFVRDYVVHRQNSRAPHLHYNFSSVSDNRAELCYNLYFYNLKKYATRKLYVFTSC